VFDLIERLVSLGVILAVTTLAIHIAGFGDLEPGDRIVRQVPGKPIILVMIEKERHKNPSLRLSFLTPTPEPFSKLLQLYKIVN